MALVDRERRGMKRSASDVERTAYHEAAHAVAALAFGRTLDLVSIRPTDGYNGICAWARPKIDPDAIRPAWDQSPDTRHAAESEILACLVGPIAGLAFWPVEGLSRPQPDACQTAAERVIEDLPPRHRDLLADLEAADGSYSDTAADEDKAMGLSIAMAGPSQAAAYYTWLHQAARDFVIDHAGAIHRVAGALLERMVLTGGEVEAIVKGAPAP